MQTRDKLSATSAERSSTDQIRRISNIGGLVYIHAWVLEGALRKWISPSATEVLYVFRDASAILFILVLYMSPGKNRSLTQLIYRSIASFAFVVVILLTVAIPGKTSIPVLAIGIRSYLAPVVGFALLYAYHTAGGDTRKHEAAVIAWLPVQAALTVAQTLSPLHSFINRVAPGEQTTLTTSLGIARASGTFTAPLGLTVYTAIAATLIVGRALTRDTRLNALQWIALLSIPLIFTLSGSRTLLIYAIPLILVSAFAAFSPHMDRGRAVLFLGFGAGVIIIASVTAPTVVTAFQERISVASTQEDSLTRLIDTSTSFLRSGHDGLFGSGAGSHSLSGIQLGSTLPWIEDEGARWAAELGLIGVLAGVVRFTISVYLAGVAIRRVLGGDPAGATLCALGFIIGLTGSVTTQPTVQGAAAILGAFIAAHLNAQVDPHFTVPRRKQPNRGGIR